MCLCAPILGVCVRVCRYVCICLWGGGCLCVPCECPLVCVSVCLSVHVCSACVSLGLCAWQCVSTSEGGCGSLRAYMLVLTWGGVFLLPQHAGVSAFEPSRGKKQAIFACLPVVGLNRRPPEGVSLWYWGTWCLPSQLPRARSGQEQAVWEGLR